jgi:hypothetical protein
VIWSAVVTFVTMPVVYLFVRSLQLRGNVILFGAAWGGAVGFLAVFLIPLIVMSNLSAPRDSLGEMIVALAAGPGLATIVGQLGGAWGGRRAIRLQFKANRLSDLLASAGGWSAPPSQSTSEVAASSSDSERPRLRFRVRHLLWITVWLSAMLSALRLAGLPLEYLLPLLLGWLVYQTATLSVGWLCVRRFVPWWSARRTGWARRAA